MSDAIEDLLAEFWALREAGEAQSIDQFVGRHPAHAAQLRPALAAMLDVAELLPAVELPASIGGYVVEGLLGRGATGEVFAVRDASGRPLALKRLLPHAAFAQRAQQRLLREADVLCCLDHAGIVDVVEIGEDAATGVPFLVMELVEGTTLAALIQAARQQGRDRAFEQLAGPGDAWQRIARCMASIAAAIDAAHRAGVLHRDLKPGNVLVRRQGTPVLIDFGLAADAAAATLTGTGDLLGTPQYMAPEQARGLAATPASDVYGIGAVLFELLTLAPPRAGADALQVLTMARHRQPPSPRALVSDVPRELDLITRRAMAFRRRYRYGSVAELARALQHVAAGGRPIRLSLSLALRVDEFWRRRRAAVLASAAVCLLALLTWWVVDLRSEARARELQMAMVAAFESHLDGDEQGVFRATGSMIDGDEPALAHWLRGEPSSGDEFVAELAAGQQLAQKRPNEAVGHLQNAVRLRPELAIASGWLGIAAVRAEQNELAERELTAAVRSLPDSVRLRVELGRLLRQLDRAPEALAHLEHAVSRPRADADTWHELAKARLVAGRHEQALDAIDRALAGATTARRRLTFLRTKAVLFDAMKRHEESLPILAQIVELQPSRNALMSYAIVLDRTHRIREAGDIYRRVLAEHPDDAQALLGLACLHAGSNRDCAQCRAYFEAHPDLVDAALVDGYATDLLRAQAGSFAQAEAAAGYVRQSGGGERFAAAIDGYLREDHPAEALGRLLRARRILRGE